MYSIVHVFWKICCKVKYNMFLLKSERVCEQGHSPYCIYVINCTTCMSYTVINLSTNWWFTSFWYLCWATGLMQVTTQYLLFRICVLTVNLLLKKWIHLSRIMVLKYWTWWIICVTCLRVLLMRYTSCFRVKVMSFKVRRLYTSTPCRQCVSS